MAENTESNNKLEFFSDIQQKLVLIAAGLLSITTIVPMFVNNIRDIFHLSVEVGFYVFVFVYFFAPLILYITYCSIHDYVGFLQLLPPKQYDIFLTSKTGRQRTEFGIFILALLFLIVSFPPYIGLAILMMLSASALVIRQTFDEGRRSAPGKGLFKEFLIIGSSIFVLFLAFYVLNFDAVRGALFQNQCVQADAFQYYKYNDNLDSLIDQTSLLKHNAYKEFVFSKALCQITSENKKDKTTEVPDSLCLVASGLAAADRRMSATASVSKMVTDIVKRKITGNAPEVYRQCAILDEYAKTVRASAQNTIKEKWVRLIQQIQYKGLLWLLILILLSLCLWLRMNLKLLKLKAVTFPLAVPADDIAKVTDNIAQIKTLIYILLLLVLPFFRHIEKKDIDLSKPYLNFSLANVFKGSFDINPGNGGSDSSSFNITIENIPGSISTDSLSKSIDSLKKRVDVLAAHTIQNGDEYDEYLKLDSTKMKKK